MKLAGGGAAATAIAYGAKRLVTGFTDSIRDVERAKGELATLAGEHDLEPKVAEALKVSNYEHLDQTDESDINFLTRISKDHDAIATVKGQAFSWARARRSAASR